VGVGERGHGVGEAGPGGDQGDSHASAQIGLGLRHVHRRALVAHVHHLDAEPGERVPQRLDVAAAEPEHPAHPAAPQLGREQPGDGGGAHGIQNTAVSV
jgi:hypothetical protein